MAQSFDIWQDKIILRWDKTVPEEIQRAYERLSTRRKAEKSVHAFAREFALPRYWQHIGPFIKWNDKVHGFFMSFSQQNLKRLHREFGQIECKRGRERIEALKLKLHELRAMRERFQHFLHDPIEAFPKLDFKMPPLGAYQHRGVGLLTYAEQVAMFADCGVGKTYMALVSSQNQIEQGLVERGKILVTGKLPTLETGWLEDTAKFTNLKAKLLWIPGTSKRREKLAAMLDEPADIYIINHEGILVLEEELAAKNFQKVVIDESTILKSFRSEGQRTGGKFGQAVMRVAHAAKWRVIMSGTPAPNGPEDLWGQYKFLDKEGLVLESSFYDFRAEFMDEIVYGKREGPSTKSKWVVPKHNYERIAALTDPQAYRIRIRDHLHDLPERTVIKRGVPMSKEQLGHYSDMDKELSTVINDKFISVDIKLTQLMKLRQVTGGFLIDQEENAHPIEDNPKLEAMDDLLNEEIAREDKVVIYAQYRWEVTTLAARYKDHGVVTVYGENSAKKNLENIKAFINDPSVRLIILHPKSMAHGVTFTVAHYMIFYSISYSAEDDYQAQKRIERAGQKNAMFFYYLLAKDSVTGKASIDERIYAAVQEKQHNQSMLIDQQSAEQALLSSYAA